MSGVPVPFHTFLWKIASRCNINCSYCYIYNSQDTQWRRQPHLMSESVARQTAARIFEHCRNHDKRDVVITFHGGEPLLGGVKHLEMLTRVIRATFEDRGISVALGMQSNGMLFRPEIGDLMLDRRISIGVSLDGPPAVNDRYRVDHKGNGTSCRVEQGLRFLLSPRYRSLFAGYLCKIDIENDPLEVARYFFSPASPIACDWPRVDFTLPHNNHSYPPPGKVHGRGSTLYGDWLIKIFDYWFDEAKRGRIRMFAAIMSVLLGGPPEVESLGTAPVDLIVVETNGEIEGVDTLKSTFDGAAGLGFNVFEHDFDTVARHSAVVRRQIGLDALCRQCRECPIVHVCGGGYLPHRFAAQSGFDNPSVYCADLMKLIYHIGDRLYRQLDQEPQLLARARAIETMMPL
jgi:uncharacterized protein